MAAVERIWIESTNEYEALCVLGALTDYDARLRRVDDRYQVEVALDTETADLLSEVHHAVQDCLTEHGIDSVVVHLGRQSYTLGPSA